MGSRGMMNDKVLRLQKCLWKLKRFFNVFNNGQTYIPYSLACLPVVIPAVFKRESLGIRVFWIPAQSTAGMTDILFT
jgi:hypothetical protein